MMNLKEEQMQNRIGFIDTGKNSEQNTDSTGIKTPVTETSGTLNTSYSKAQDLLNKVVACSMEKKLVL